MFALFLSRVGKDKGKNTKIEILLKEIASFNSYVTSPLEMVKLSNCMSRSRKDTG
jgi:hypothetical protein